MWQIFWLGVAVAVATRILLQVCACFINNLSK